MCFSQIFHCEFRLSEKKNAYQLIVNRYLKVNYATINELIKIGVCTLNCFLDFRSFDVFTRPNAASDRTRETERVIKRRGQERGRQRPFVEKLSKAQSAQSAARCVQAASDMGLCVC